VSFLIIAAIGLFFILEGILPFLAPKLWRKMVNNMQKQSDKALHITGLVSMIFGLILVVLAHLYLT
jgi:uncharacterized protein YjeT (DUF2065 family)